MISEITSINYRTSMSSPPRHIPLSHSLIQLPQVEPCKVHELLGIDKGYV